MSGHPVEDESCTDTAWRHVNEIDFVGQRQTASISWYAQLLSAVSDWFDYSRYTIKHTNTFILSVTGCWPRSWLPDAEIWLLRLHRPRSSIRHGLNNSARMAPVQAERVQVAWGRDPIRVPKEEERQEEWMMHLQLKVLKSKSIRFEYVQL